jgi:hypothetical protein
MWHPWEKGEHCARFWWEILKKRDYLEDRGIDGRMGSKWALGRVSGRLWSGFIWLRILTGGGLL